jgi:hypothetical protein
MLTSYKTDSNMQVDVIRRPMLIVQSELMEDLKPFFHINSLFQDADERGAGIPFRGNLISVEAPTLYEVILTFGPFNAPPVRRHLVSIRSSTLTIWRVNNVLDALQVFILTDNAAVYLQTGGEALLTLLPELKAIGASDPNGVDLFNEPILYLRNWGSSKKDFS